MGEKIRGNAPERRGRKNIETETAKRGALLELIFSKNDLICRADELMSPPNELICGMDELRSLQNDLNFRADELMSPQNDLICGADELMSLQNDLVREWERV